MLTALKFSIGKRIVIRIDSSFVQRGKKQRAGTYLTALKPFDGNFDGYKIWYKKRFRTADIQGKALFYRELDRFGKTGTDWKIEKNVYNLQQICYGI